jgi:hypothetical protein
VLPAQPWSSETGGPHEAGDALVIDPLAVLAELGGDPRDAAGPSELWWMVRIRAASFASAAWRAALAAAVLRQ